MDFNELFKELLDAEARIKEAYENKKRIIKKLNNILIYQGYGTVIRPFVFTAEWESSLKSQGLL